MELQYINGNFSHSLSGQILTIADAVGETVTAQVTKSAREDVHAAVAAAKSALKTFYQSPIHSRQHVISKICDRLEDELKTAGMGVIGVLLSMYSSYVHIASVLGPALICGNSVVIKVSEKEPLHTLSFSKILADVDVLPVGLVNFITGSALEAGAELVRHHDVAKIVFAGSLRVANFAFESCQLCRPVKQTWMALNFKAPALVLGDADIDQVVRCVQDSVFGDSAAPSAMIGECLVVDRVFVVKDVASELLSKLVDMVKELPHDEDDDHLSHCHNAHHQKDFTQTQCYIRHHMDKGAHVAVGGAGISFHLNSHVSQAHMQPTVLVSGHDAPVGALATQSDQMSFHAELAKDSALVDFQEISAPLVHVVVCDTAADMIVLANQQTQFLKQAYCAVFSDSFACISEYAQHLAAPTIVFNDLQASTESHLRDASVLAFFSESKAVMWTHHTALSRHKDKKSEGVSASLSTASAGSTEDARKTAPDVPTIETHLSIDNLSVGEEAVHVMDTSSGDAQTGDSHPAIQPDTLSHADTQQSQPVQTVSAPSLESESPLHRADDMGERGRARSESNTGADTRNVSSTQQKSEQTGSEKDQETSSPMHKMHRVGSPSFAGPRSQSHSQSERKIASQHVTAEALPASQSVNALATGSQHVHHHSPQEYHRHSQVPLDGAHFTSQGVGVSALASQRNLHLDDSFTPPRDDQLPVHMEASPPSGDEAKKTQDLGPADDLRTQSAPVAPVFMTGTAMHQGEGLVNGDRAADHVTPTAPVPGPYDPIIVPVPVNGEAVGAEGEEEQQSVFEKGADKVHRVGSPSFATPHNQSQNQTEGQASQSVDEGKAGDIPLNEDSHVHRNLVPMGSQELSSASDPHHLTEGQKREEIRKQNALYEGAAGEGEGEKDEGKLEVQHLEEVENEKSGVMEVIIEE
eukprot:gene21997-28087_t